ncbi:MAG: cyclic nucleotide-binding domain-containing protein [Deltaproteobacteria bacterium]|nr:cyclic nucleotide-binding domain-containing protein [Deltaproteobacteria bacterium]
MAELDAILWEQNRIFAAAGSATCADFSQRYPTQAHEPDTVLARVGDPASELRVLLTGTVRIFHETPDGRQTVVKLMRAPNVFGDIELLHELDFLENVAAVDSIRLALIPATDYQAFLDAHPTATKRHLEHMAAAFCVVARHERAMLSPLEERLANLLLSYAELFGQLNTCGDIVFSRPLSQPEMATSLGVSTRAIAQVLSSWHKTGLLAKKERKVALRDLAALRKLALPVRGSLRYEMGMSLDHLARGGGEREVASAELQLVSDEHPLCGQTFPICDELIVGSQVPSQLRLVGAAIEAQHCRIFRATTGGKFWVEDLQTAAGTWLRGKRVSRAVLRDGDEFQLGGTRLRFSER